MWLSMVAGLKLQFSDNSKQTHLCWKKISDKNRYFCQANSFKYFQNPFLARSKKKKWIGVEIRHVSKEGLIEMGFFLLEGIMIVILWKSLNISKFFLKKDKINVI